MNTVLVSLDGQLVNIIIESGGLAGASAVSLAALTAAVVEADAAAAAAAEAAAVAVAATANKANLSGDNVIGANAAAFLTAIGGDLASNIYLQKAGAKVRSLKEIEETTVNLLRIIPLAVDITTADITVYLREAVVLASSEGKSVWVPEGYTFIVDTFDQVLSSGSICAVKVAASVTIDGPGTLTSTNAFSRTIFGVDETAGAAEIRIRNIQVAGDSRYYFLRVAPLATLSVVEVWNVRTERQAVSVTGTVSRELNICENTLGLTTGAGIAHSPFINIVLTPSLSDAFALDCSRNVVYTGTDPIAGAFVFHGVPPGGHTDDNWHINVPGVATEGFDIDNYGRLASFCGNKAIYSGIEYKEGSGGAAFSRDIIFNDNLSYKSWDSGISLRAGCMAKGNIVFDPATWGLYVADFGSGGASTELDVDAFLIIWAGANAAGNLVRVDGGLRKATVRGLRVVIDPAYKAANPSSYLPGRGMRCEGTALDNYSFYDCWWDDLQTSGGGSGDADYIYMAPTAGSRVLFEDCSFGSAGGKGYDIRNITGLEVVRPKYRGTITGRKLAPISCVGVRVNAPGQTDMVYGIASGGNTFMTVNGYGAEAAGVGNTPSANILWPIGAIVQNTDDVTFWVRVSESATGATAWKLLQYATETGWTAGTGTPNKGAIATYSAGAAITPPVGGAVIDAEARTAIGLLITQLANAETALQAESQRRLALEASQRAAKLIN